MAEKLIEGEDYYLNKQGMFVFTEKYHLKPGYCCKNECKHCPYGFKKKKRNNP
jgi:2-iminoacetate synthase ThiH